MPEPYYEVMKYYEAGRKSVESPAMLVTNVGAAASGIVSSLLTAEAGRTLDTLKDVIKDYLGRNIEIASALRDMKITDIPAQLENLMEIDYKNIIDLVKGGIGQGVGGIHGSFYETLNGTNALVTGYNGLIQRIGIDPFISRWVNETVRPNIPDANTAWFMSNIGAIDTDAYKAYLGQNGWDESWIPALDMANRSMPSIDILLALRRRNIIDDPALKSMLHWFRFGDTEVNRVIQLAVQYPEPYRLAEMYSKGLTSTDEFLGVSRTFGLEDNWSLLWAEGQRRYPDFMTSLALLRRGDISEETFYYWMQRDQVSPEETEVMLKLKEVIPSPSDLTYMAAREGFGDHTYAAQYPALETWITKMGWTKEMASSWWYAHWIRTALPQAYENLWRGLWDKDKFENWMAIVDIHPDDREDIYNVAFRPPSIREMGYGWDVGAYTREDIIRYRRWGGLNLDDATKAGDSMIAYRTEAERNSIRTELMYALGDDRIDAETFIQKLLDLNTQEAAIDLWVERAELYRERALLPANDIEGKTVSSSEAISAFKAGLIGEAPLRVMLKALLWIDARIDLAIEKAKFDMEQEKAKSEEVKYRKLTIAQITNSYNLQLITKEDMTTEFILIGYSPDDASLLTDIYTAPTLKPIAIKNYTITDAVKLYRYQLFDETDIYENYLAEGYDSAHSATLTLMTKLDYDYPILASLYERGYINSEQITFELKKMGLDEKHIKLLLDRTMYTYQVSRLASEKDLTKAEILKGAKNNVFTVTQAAGLLEGIGYDENEAYYLLAINKIVVAGDPDGYWEMRRATELYKKARGLAYVTIPDELIMLETNLKEAQAKINELKKTPEKEEEIKNAALTLNTVEQRMRELISKLGLK